MAGDPNVVIRPISSIDEFHAVEQLQRDVWGIPDLDVVSLYQLIAVQASGGVLLGAFDGEDLVGFAYGFVGLERGRTVHHSHMLAVTKEQRSHGLGYRLKCAQRDFVLDQGIEIMTWTFDPLQSRNAFLNFRKLGVVADTYLPDFYGSDASSFLHRNGTDRLWVSWHLSHRHVRDRLSGSIVDEVSGDHAVLVSVGSSGQPVTNDAGDAEDIDRLVIEIPGEIDAIGEADPELARAWRRHTRKAFRAAIDAGFLVEDFFVAERSGQRVGSYVLARKSNLRLW
ncbi:MAG: hypothetical protein IPM25_08890 [Chloracidobacterium sp.]|nr:hypothetical protein [Chloracidobacterium sp.]